MLIEIENTSSPGASFTSNTNEVLLLTYEWICEHSGITIPFREFRKRLQAEKGINDNNNRNIYPLLKNSGLVTYEKGCDLLVDDFYTNTGLAYVKTLEASKMLEEEDYAEEQKIIANKKFDGIREEIISGALLNLIKQPDVNYVEPLQDLIKFILKFGKINKLEFAYLLFAKQTKDINEALITIEPEIEQYRSGELEIEVSVKVRNDIDLRQKTNSDKRKEGLGFLTSYGYFIGLLSQAGLVVKDDGYYLINEERRKTLEKLEASYEF